MANEMITLRTPLLIAAEINEIKYQTGKILLANTIEIGRRLTEAKALIEYGKWGKWLEDEVNYSQRTAQNLMRLYEAYGSKQPAAFNAVAQSPEIPNLSYTQAFILLGVPEEERAEFIAEMDIESMSTRELQKAVKERKLALEDRDKALQEKADLRKALDEQSGKITRLTEERDNLKTEANGLRESKRTLEQEVEKKKTDLDKIKKSAAYDSIQKMSNNLTAAYNRAAANKVAFLYESLEKTFKELAREMTEFAPVDPEVHAAYKQKVNDFLLNAMKARLEN